MSFLKTTYEFGLNYMFNPKFKDLCDSMGIMYVGFYGETTADYNDMKKAMKNFGYRKKSVIWLHDTTEVDTAIDVSFDVKKYNEKKGRK